MKSNNIPLDERSERSGFIDETFLKISQELFEFPYFGYGIGAIFNIYYLYYWYKKATLFSLFYLIFLFYIITKIIKSKILGR